MDRPTDRWMGVFIELIHLFSMCLPALPVCWDAWVKDTKAPRKVGLCLQTMSENGGRHLRMSKY